MRGARGPGRRLLGRGRRERETAEAGVWGRHNGKSGDPQAPRRRPLPPCFSPSWSSRRCCLSHCLPKTPAQGRAGTGARSAAPCGLLAVVPGWVGGQAAAATLGPDGGRAPRAGSEGGKEEGGVGEAVGGLTVRMGFFALEPDSPQPAPRAQNRGRTKETLISPCQGGAAVGMGGSGKRRTL